MPTGYKDFTVPYIRRKRVPWIHNIWIDGKSMGYGIVMSLVPSVLRTARGWGSTSARQMKPVSHRDFFLKTNLMVFLESVWEASREQFFPDRSPSVFFKSKEQKIAATWLFLAYE
jgi:hypothetical protein